MVRTAPANRLSQHWWTGIGCDDRLNIGHPMGDVGPVARIERHMLPGAQARVLNDPLRPLNPTLLQRPEVKFDLGDVRGFGFVTFLGFMHGLGRCIVKVDFYGAQTVGQGKFQFPVFVGPLGVGCFANKFALVHDIGIVLHADFMGVKPKFAPTYVVEVDECGVDGHGEPVDGGR